jgi:hypothetical protein
MSEMECQIWGRSTQEDLHRLINCAKIEVSQSSESGDQFVQRRAMYTIDEDLAYRITAFYAIPIHPTPSPGQTSYADRKGWPEIQ